jgi:hypothetical protein
MGTIRIRRLAEELRVRRRRLRACDRSTAAGQTLTPEARAALEDQLAVAGLDVLTPLNQAVDDV